MTYGTYYGRLGGWQPGPTKFEKGDVVVVKSGRKLRLGIVGRVFWAGWKNYSGRWVERVGLVELGDASETALWTSAYNLRDATPEEVVPTVEAEDPEAYYDAPFDEEAPKSDLVALALSLGQDEDLAKTLARKARQKSVEEAFDQMAEDSGQYDAPSMMYSEAGQ